jgi:hypothetical protein
MRQTEPPFDDAWALARIREVWEWAVKKDRHFIAYLLGMAILAFDLDAGDGKFKESKAKSAAIKQPKRAP